MIFKSASECFVYIMLPRATQSVTAGKFVLSNEQHGKLVGRFVYGDKYLSRPDAVEIDPVELKLVARTYDTTRLGGVFGAIRDSSPDYWGRKVIEKHSGKSQLGEIDCLLESPDDRAGALGFGIGKEPPALKRKYNKTLDLKKLQQLADGLINDELNGIDQESVQVQDLVLLRTSLGGTRPKAVVEDSDGLWVAKFSRSDDRWNNPRVEHAMLELARQCGVNSASSRIETIAGKDVLLVKRFDREKVGQAYARARMISGLTLLRAEDSPQHRDRWSYVSMAEELRRITPVPKRDVAQLFRRMCFNGLISNLDDHPRNHALIAMDKEWRLSPAFDLTPSPVISEDRRDLAMICGNAGTFANKENLLSQRTRFLLERDEAAQIISSMQVQIQSTWYNVVRSCGVSTKDAETIRRAFVYPGFDRSSSN